MFHEGVSAMEYISILIKPNYIKDSIIWRLPKIVKKTVTAVYTLHYIDADVYYTIKYLHKVAWHKHNTNMNSEKYSNRDTILDSFWLF